MEFWPSLAAIILLLLGFIILLWHTAIDLKLRLLPDELNIALVILGMLFHWVAYPHAGTWTSVAIGMVLGGGALWLVRAVANRIYAFETMGLGDVKLLCAFGVWLGPEGVLYALMGGAFAGVLHGMAMILYSRAKSAQALAFREMTVPAGPGFCIGAIAAAFWQFRDLPLFGGF
ncbi:MAG TPA: A24 family peptidase [Alphaproteobacteria bacterium]